MPFMNELINNWFNRQILTLCSKFYCIFPAIVLCYNYTRRSCRFFPSSMSQKNFPFLRYQSNDLYRWDFEQTLPLGVRFWMLRWWLTSSVTVKDCSADLLPVLQFKLCHGSDAKLLLHIAIHCYGKNLSVVAIENCRYIQFSVTALYFGNVGK